MSIYAADMDKGNAKINENQQIESIKIKYYSAKITEDQRWKDEMSDLCNEVMKLFMNRPNNLNLPTVVTIDKNSISFN